MGRYNEKCAYDAWQDKIAEDKQERKWARETYCNRDCEEHNENCPYYDSEQEVWDYDECFRDNGWY